MPGRPRLLWLAEEEEHKQAEEDAGWRKAVPTMRDDNATARCAPHGRPSDEGATGAPAQRGEGREFGEGREGT